MSEIKCPKCGAVLSLEQSDFDEIVRQVRDEEFHKELEERLRLIAAEKQRAIELAEEKAASKFREYELKKEGEIKQLQAEISSQKERFSSQQELAITRAVSKLTQERDALRTEMELNKAEQVRSESQMREQFAEQQRTKDEVIALQNEQIDRLKDLKARLTTKMVGEELETHCANQFNAIRSTAFPNATFERDTDATSGSKGDFIFREYDESGVELVSIMFEMKNQEEDSRYHKRNEDHLAKLDKDRTNKGCEYAVLVSLLEPDSDLYNAGIVDLSWKYPKMYVVRPQCFIPIISLIRNAAQSALIYKKELELAKQQNLDVSNFEKDLDTFKAAFFKNFENASLRFEDAISAIDKAIKDLETAKKKLVISEKHLTSANNKLDGLTVKKLTRNNPTMKAKFDEAVGDTPDQKGSK